jgi:hypothetical protein
VRVALWVGHLNEQAVGLLVECDCMQVAPGDLTMPTLFCADAPWRNEVGVRNVVEWNNQSATVRCPRCGREKTFKLETVGQRSV